MFTSLIQVHIVVSTEKFSLLQRRKESGNSSDLGGSEQMTAGGERI